jgi:hypothetical protein
MTGKQIHSIVHRLDMIGKMRQDAHDRMMAGDRKRGLCLYRAADKVFGRTYDDTLRWMNRKQFSEFCRAAEAERAHSSHAQAKRLRCAA